VKAIWKYPIPINNFSGITIHVPHYADRKFNEQVLYCEVQNGTPCLWVLVDDENEARAIRVVVAGTGHGVDSMIEGKLVHVGSFMLLDGNFVGHVFVSKG
jgi:hypothetical protein